MSTFPVYNSAVKGGTARQHPPLQRHEGKHGLALAWDAFNGLPPEMLERADVLYGEVPFPTGFIKFAERAGVKQAAAKYADLCTAIGNAVRASGKPAICLSGKPAMPHLKPDEVIEGRFSVPGKFTNAGCQLGLYNGFTKAEFTKLFGAVPEAELVIFHLATRFNTVGDFVCGNGKSGYIFASSGKRYVMSDFDPYCIGYIAAHEASWTC